MDFLPELLRPRQISNVGGVLQFKNRGGDPDCPIPVVESSPMSRVEEAPDTLTADEIEKYRLPSSAR